MKIITKKFITKLIIDLLFWLGVLALIWFFVSCINVTLNNCAINQQIAWWSIFNVI